MLKSTTSTSALHCFKWTGITLGGQKKQGVLIAADKAAAQAQLNQWGILLAHLQPQHSRAFSYLFFKSRKAQSAVFYHQLAVLIEAGIPLTTALENMRMNHLPPSFKTILNAIQHALEQGNRLGKVLQQFPHYFDALSCQLIQVGEWSGTLAAMLKRCASHHEQQIQLTRRLRQAYLYPAILFISASFISLFMLLYIVPRFADLFNSMHAALPPLTLLVIHSANWLINYGQYGLWLIGMLSVMGYYGYKHIPAWQKQFSQLCLRVPMLGRFRNKVITVRLARSLAITFQAGIPLSEALLMIAPTLGHPLYTEALRTIHYDLSTGQPLHACLQKYSIFLPFLVNMVKIGEESGRLDDLLIKIAELYEAEIDHFIHLLSQALEPLLMLILGVLIGGLVLAMYLPLFNLGTVI